MKFKINTPVTKTQKDIGVLVFEFKDELYDSINIDTIKFTPEVYDLFEFLLREIFINYDSVKYIMDYMKSTNKNSKFMYNLISMLVKYFAVLVKVQTIREKNEIRINEIKELNITEHYTLKLSKLKTIITACCLDHTYRTNFVITPKTKEFIKTISEGKEKIYLSFETYEQIDTEARLRFEKEMINSVTKYLSVAKEDIVDLIEKLRRINNDVSNDIIKESEESVNTIIKKSKALTKVIGSSFHLTYTNYTEPSDVFESLNTLYLYQEFRKTLKKELTRLMSELKNISINFHEFEDKRVYDVITCSYTRIYDLLK